MKNLSVRKISYVSLFAALTAIGGFISIPIPFSPIPLTLQTTFTSMAGFVLGSRYGALSQLVYLLLGAIGLPIFSNRTGGLSTLSGPTAGFLWGFIISAFIVGLIREKYQINNPILIFFVQLIGLIVTYILGVIGLMLILNITFTQSFMVGVAPFIVLDLIKLGVATLLILRLQKANILFNT